MTQNRSHAVMAQRAEPHDSLDDFPTPPWATRALLTHVLPRAVANYVPHEESAWEPACNRGFMLRPLQEWFSVAWGTDIHDYGIGYPQHDFLQPYLPLQRPTIDPPNWIITNPPFRLGPSRGGASPCSGHWCSWYC